MQVALMEFLESKWEEPDNGIWEVRGDPKQFTHSKMMAWVAFDRAVKLAEASEQADQAGLERWRKIRDRIHRQVCRCGYNAKKRAFTQYYGRMHSMRAS